MLWRYDNAFLFTNQSEVDFGIAHVLPTGTEEFFTHLNISPVLSYYF